jgi:t-SNARE complex subunit (syntaxin)
MYTKRLSFSTQQGTRKMKHFDIEVFVKDLDKLFNDMQDKAIAGSENVATASWVIKNQAKHIKQLEECLESSMKLSKALVERYD